MLKTHSTWNHEIMGASGDSPKNPPAFACSNLAPFILPMSTVFYASEIKLIKSLEPIYNVQHKKR